MALIFYVQNVFPNVSIITVVFNSVSATRTGSNEFIHFQFATFNGRTGA